MSSVNKKGNRRGVTGKSKDALAKARESRRKGPGRGRNAESRIRATQRQKPPVALPRPVKPPTSFAPLVTGSLEKLHEEVRGPVELLQQEPGALTATLLGTLMANLNKANNLFPKLWKWVEEQIDDTEGASPLAMTKVLAELRQWVKTLADPAIKVAEIQARGLNQPLEPKDGLEAYRESDEEDEPEEDELAAVDIDEPAPEPLGDPADPRSERDETDDTVVKIG